MIYAAMWAGYFAIGVAGFFAFWRWFSDDNDDAGDKFAAFSILFAWPLVAVCLAFWFVMAGLLVLGKKVKKK